MAMLAGPRRKQKVINLRAKNSEWSKDSSKFGQRMLEKMGWSSGKGLGANENGIVEHVVARYKNDEKGLGFEDKNDQWTKHEDDFNSLLANLSSGGNNDNKLHSGVSLEVKSKKSKARVHYQKFTRGKDISRYSEKDLANIFGKRTFQNENKEPIMEIAMEDIKIKEQVFTEKGSMDDYFKTKMAAFKSKHKSFQNNTPLEKDCDNEADFAFKGFSGTANDEDSHEGFGFQPFVPVEPSNDISKKETEQALEEDIQHVKKKKKDKKSKKQDILEFVESSSSKNIILDSAENPGDEASRKKVKRSKTKKDICSQLIEPEPFEEEAKISDDNLIVEITEACKYNSSTRKDKKSKKNKLLDNKLVKSETFEEILQVKKKSSKKKRIASTSNLVAVNEEVLESVQAVEHVPKKKKKRKHQEI